MRILLTTLNSKYIHSNLALRYLYTVGKSVGADVELREFTINNEDDYIYTELVRANYDLVCFSCYVWNIENIKEICKNLKLAKPETKILLGGPEVTYCAKEFMETNTYIDYIIVGEGEEPMKELCERSLREKEFSNIPRLVIRQGDKIIENADFILPDIEKVPFPYELLKWEDDKVIYYESSRGCPFRCGYCLSSIDKTIRPLPLERVKGELALFVRENVKQVKFIDRTFNFDKKRAMEIWSYLIESDNGVTNFHFEVCGELLDEEVVKLLKSARKGLFQLEIGIQSTNEKTLKAVNRSPKLEGIFKYVREILEFGNIHVHVDLIAGLPYEDYNSFKNSFNDVYSLHGDNLQLGFLKLLKGTQLWNEREEHQFLIREKAPYEVIATKYITAKELVKLKMIDKVLDLYYNKGAFPRSMAYMENALALTPYYFYDGLSEFFYEKGFQHRSHKKEDTYRILNLYIMSLDISNEEKEKCKELIYTDLEATMNFDAVKKFNRKGWEL